MLEVYVLTKPRAFASAVVNTLGRSAEAALTGAVVALGVATAPVD